MILYLFIRSAEIKSITTVFRFHSGAKATAAFKIIDR